MNTRLPTLSEAQRIACLDLLHEAPRLAREAETNGAPPQGAHVAELARLISAGKFEEAMEVRDEIVAAPAEARAVRRVNIALGVGTLALVAFVAWGAYEIVLDYETARVQRVATEEVDTAHELTLYRQLNDLQEQRADSLRAERDEARQAAR